MRKTQPTSAANTGLAAVMAAEYATPAKAMERYMHDAARGPPTSVANTGSSVPALPWNSGESSCHSRRTAISPTSQTPRSPSDSVAATRGATTQREAPA